ncbi:MAG: hypothetical protein WAK93_10550 [Solirubrobacteraceae bacterium]
MQELTAAERQCCSFAEWKVTQEERDVVLHVAADPGRVDDIAEIAVLFRAD